MLETVWPQQMIEELNQLKNTQKWHFDSIEMKPFNQKKQPWNPNPMRTSQIRTES